MEQHYANALDRMVTELEEAIQNQQATLTELLEAMKHLVKKVKSGV